MDGGMDGKRMRRDEYFCYPSLSHSAHFSHLSFLSLSVYMELSPLRFQRNLSTNFSSSD